MLSLQGHLSPPTTSPQTSLPLLSRSSSAKEPDFYYHYNFNDHQQLSNQNFQMISKLNSLRVQLRQIQLVSLNIGLYLLHDAQIFLAQIYGKIYNQQFSHTHTLWLCCYDFTCLTQHLIQFRVMYPNYDEKMISLLFFFFWCWWQRKLILSSLFSKAHDPEDPEAVWTIVLW